MHTRATLSALAAACALVGAPFIAPGLANAQPETPAQFAAAAVERHAEDDVTLRITAGANLNYGNARSLGVNLGGNFAVRHAEHAFLAELAWTYGMASSRILPAPPPGMDPDYSFGDFTENSNNFTGRVRYDFFVTPDDSIWAELRIRNDPFAFLQPQVSAQAGYQRVLIREENHRLWFELGLDFSFQRFGQDLPPNDAAGISPANQLSERSIFAYKGLLGYQNETNSGFTYNTRFEILGTLGMSRPTAAIDGNASDFGTEPGHLRMQWVNTFRSQIEDWLQFSVELTGRFDSLPAGQLEVFNEAANQPTQMFDLLATLNLVGNFDLDGSEEAEEEAEAAAECPVCPEAPPCPDCDAVDEAPAPPAEEPAPEEPAAEEPVTEEPAAEPAADDVPVE